MSVAVVFPGQGSQKVGMGEEFFDKYPEITQVADNILGYSIKELCVSDPNETLNQTNYTQPALFTVNALMYQDYLSENPEPQVVAGHSLGEYNALLAAGVFDFKTGLTIVQKRGDLMSKISGGGMAAIIGLSDDAVSQILKDNELTSIDVANYNCPGQVVISGPKADIQSSVPVFKENGAKLVVELPVSGAFHSRYMKDAETEFLEFIQQFSFTSPNISIIANVSASPYQSSDVQTTLSKQISSSVRWTESINYIRKTLNVDTFQEVGPGKVLTGLIKKIKKS